MHSKIVNKSRAPGSTHLADCQSEKTFKSFCSVFVQNKMGKIEWAMWANEQAVVSSIGKKSNRQTFEVFY